ncbi:helix-turn-helix transcriptional regulator [Kribbella sp. NBC_01505]|uniref:response regulator transcription factor n=1 Tax=Kribbella sp. NBC_01505 TaxID=2903580 RepID=UPI00386905F0
MRIGQEREGTVRRALGVLQHTECFESPWQLWSALYALICAGELRRADQHCLWLATHPRTSPEILAGIRLFQARIRQLRGQVTHALETYSEPAAPDDRLIAMRTAWTVEAMLDLGEARSALPVLHARRLDGVIALDLPGRGPLLTARGQLYLALGTSPRAIADFVDSSRPPTDGPIDNPAISSWRSRAALALAKERPPLAARLAEEELMLAMRWGAPRQIGWALHAHAVVRDDQQTAALLSEAIDLLEVADARNELVPVLFATAGHLAAKGDSLAARKRLTRASELARLDSRMHWAKRIDSALHRLQGRRPHPMLTRQQLRVTSLARAGSTNRHIASQLNLSVRAVEFHLSAAYRRLGISGRAELYQMMG